MEYHLYPPFFTIEGEDFDDAWEILCCRLLSLKYKTVEISRTKAPDEGIDLYWETRKIAFQCKAVSLGGKLNLTKVKNSIDRAIEKQAELGWQKYILCTNVDLARPTLTKIKRMLPTIGFITGTQWQNLCIEFDYAIDPYFLQLIKLSRNKIINSLNVSRFQHYRQQLQETTTSSPFNLIVCCNRYHELIELPVLPEYSVSELTEVLRKLFELPKRINYQDARFSFYMDYSIEFDNKEVPPNKRLSEIPFKENPIVTFRIEQYEEDQDGRYDGNTLYLITPDMIKYVTLSEGERRQIAIKRHQEETAQLLKQAIERLREE